MVVWRSAQVLLTFAPSLWRDIAVVMLPEVDAIQMRLQVTPAAVRQITSPAAQTATPPSTDAHHSSEEGELIHPLQQGVIQSWDALETLLHYALYKQV